MYSIVQRLHCREGSVGNIARQLFIFMTFDWIMSVDATRHDPANFGQLINHASDRPNLTCGPAPHFPRLA